MNKIFFTEERGITSTSATAIANYSVETKNALMSILQNVNFVDELRDVVGTASGEKKVRSGYSSETAKALLSLAHKCAKLDSLNAWLREAVKAKEAWLEEIQQKNSMEIAEFPESLKRPSRKSIIDYCREHDIEVPKAPEHRYVSEQDIVEEMDVKTYCKYLASNSSAAVFGKLAHEAGALNKARKELHNRCAADYEVSDTLIQHFVPTVDGKTVDAVFADFQATQRSYNAEHNSMHSKVLDELNRRQRALDEEYQLAFAKYTEATDKIDDLISAEFEAEYAQYLKDQKEYTKAYQNALLFVQEWRRAETERVSKLKIIIPNDLEETFAELNEALKK